MKTGPQALVFFTLCTGFILYSLSIYTTPAGLPPDKRFDRELAAEGRLVFQQYNCQSCHQLYGLGGYLGPDLTNLRSDSLKGEAYIRTVIQYGMKQMPAYSLKKHEMAALLEFLKSTAASGNADPRSIKVMPDGMVQTP